MRIIVIVPAVALALHARAGEAGPRVAALAESSDLERDKDETPAILVPAPPPAPDAPVDRWDLPTLRADGGLGFALGNGPGSFAARGHVGLSRWVLEPEDPARDWRTAARFTAGLALGMDFAGSQQVYATAAPFVEIGIGIASAANDSHSARQATMFVRAEPVLAPGALHERALRIGAGLSLHNYAHGMPDVSSDHGMDREQTEADIFNTAAMALGSPILAALNLRDVEVTADIGEDGRTRFGLLLGFWSR